MPHYAYRARDAQGKAIQGVMEGTSADAVARLLGAVGAIPLEIREENPQASLLAQWSRQAGLGYPGRVDLMLFTRQMYSLAKAGVPIASAMRRLAQTTRNAVLAEAIEAMIAELEGGRELATSMARHPKLFTPLVLAVVRVGEETGRLDEAFLRLNEHFDREQRVVEQVKTALRYPAIVLGFIVVAMFVLMSFVIPEFAKLYGAFEIELPLPTRILIAVSGFMAEWWFALLLGIAGALGWLRHYIGTPVGRERWHGLLLRMPIFGSIVLRATMARFARAFAMAMRSGVPVLQALGVVSLAVDNTVIEKQLVGMRTAIERGESLTRAASLQSSFTPLVLQMLAVGEDTGRVDEMLVEVAEFYEREVDYDVRNLNDLLQPIVTVIVAGMVFVLALGVLLPMWDLVNLARR
jgi:MSHA biogenesis protein MshG